MKLNERWFPQIVDRNSGNLYPIYIKQKLGLCDLFACYNQSLYETHIVSHIILWSLSCKSYMVS